MTILSHRETRKSAVLLALVLSAAACERQDPAPPKVEPPKAASQAPARGPSEDARITPQVSYAEVVDRVGPGVVTIRSQRRVRAPRQFPFSNDPLLREFFGGLFGGAAPGQESRQMGIGSGVIVRSDGYILTNHHVVDGAQEIRIEFTDRRGFNAKLIGNDPPSDLAVLKIDAKDLTALSLGNSDEVRVGDVVLAVGNPLGIGQTVTAGIISAKGRSTGLSDGSFEDFLQTDAPINQGNSGGALVNTSGLLVGINSQIVSPSGGNIGIGFAIPSNMARVVMEQLINTGKVERGHLGIAIQPVTPEIAGKLNLSETRGVIVENVAADSAAARAGIRPGDILVAFNGQPVTDGNTLRNQVAATRPGTQIDLTVLRDGREQVIGVALGEYKPPPAAQRTR
jgi:serine protease Do